MKPNYYIDIVTKSISASSPDAMTALPVMTRIMSVMHGIIRTKSLPLAIALPKMQEGTHRHPGTMVRVFSDTLENLQIVQNDIAANLRLAPYVHCHFPKSVPKKFVGPWVEYRRFRIPAERSRCRELREQCLHDGENLPFFRLASKATQQAFSLHVKCVKKIMPDDYSSTVNCMPDSYGLSNTERTFFLPSLAT